MKKSGKSREKWLKKLNRSGKNGNRNDQKWLRQIGMWQEEAWRKIGKSEIISYTLQ